MAAQTLNLPINIPWHLIAASPDMMVVDSCEHPVEWKSSLAIYAFEPSVEDLPLELCEQRITYLKVTTSITGYQPSGEETRRALDALGHLSLEATEQLDKILREYWACYGVLINVAVLPHPATQVESIRESINFADVRIDPPLRNPLSIERPSTKVLFNALGQTENRLVDRFPANGDGRLELDLPKDVEITFEHASDRRVISVEARVAHFPATMGITMSAFSGSDEVGRQTTTPNSGEEQTLLIEVDGIDKVVLHHINSFNCSLFQFTCVLSGNVPVELEDYPHIISLEPKTRDLYQSATESGEILTASASSVKTDKSMANTQSSESGVSVEAIANVAKPPFSGSAKGTYSHTWGETNQDSMRVQVDSSREKRETQGTTTNLSQLYNLLTGYHAGTNRAVFLMLPRPHILEPTDRRTFIQGLRYIEGMQEFFMIVSRPRGIEGLRIEACLDTGHFPEDVQVIEPPVEYDKSHEDFVVTAESNDNGARSIEDFTSSRYAVASGWVIDRSEGDFYHRGVHFIGGSDEDGNFGSEVGDNGDLPAEGTRRIRVFNYQPVGDSVVQVVGKVEEGSIRRVALRFRVFTRSEQPKRTTEHGSVPLNCLLITSRRLCAAFKSAPCPEVVPIAGSTSVAIVDEQCPEIDPALLTRDETAETRLITAKSILAKDVLLTHDVSPTLTAAKVATATRLPAMKELLRKVQSIITSNRRPFGGVSANGISFLQTDYFRDRLMKLRGYAPELSMRLQEIADLPDGVLGAFGAGATVADALKPKLSTFAKRAGLSIGEAGQIRFRLLTARPPERR